MANKTKTSEIISSVQEVAANTGVILMAGAVTLGLVEVPHSPDKRAVLPTQLHFAPAAAEGGEVNPNEMRRERDEVHPHYHSYSATQRTPGRTGKV